MSPCCLANYRTKTFAILPPTQETPSRTSKRENTELDDVKRKVMLDLFASPGTLIPMVVGISSLLLSWAVGGDPTANAIGIIGVLGGVGHFATRLVLGLEGMTERAYQRIVQRRQEEQKQALDDLEQRLSRDGDHRTETCLRDLRGLYRTFQNSCADGQVVASHHQVVSQVEEVFHASVQQLERSLELYTISQKLTGTSKTEILNERERVIEEVIDTRDHLSSTIQRFQTFATRRNQSELSRLRDELDETLRVAQRTEERMATIGRKEKNYDESEFE